MSVYGGLSFKFTQRNALLDTGADYSAVCVPKKLLNELLHDKSYCGQRDVEGFGGMSRKVDVFYKIKNGPILINIGYGCVEIKELILLPAVKIRNNARGVDQGYKEPHTAIIGRDVLFQHEHLIQRHPVDFTTAPSTRWSWTMYPEKMKEVNETDYATDAFEWCMSCGKNYLNVGGKLRKDYNIDYFKNYDDAEEEVKE